MGLSRQASSDVVVVGAGPVGLLLAIELTLGGADVIVLERLTAPNLGCPVELLRAKDTTIVFTLE